MRQRLPVSFGRKEGPYEVIRREGKKRYAGYVRVSSLDPVGALSLRMQRSAILAHTEAHGLTLTKMYADHTVSGESADVRNAFQKMLRDAEAGAFDVLIVHSLDRYARGVRGAQAANLRLQHAGIGLVSLKENIDTTVPAGKLFFKMMDAIAAFELQRIKEKVQSAKEVKVEPKTTFKGRAPYGYRWNKASAAFEVVPEQAAIYRRIVMMYLQKGLSLRAIAAQLSAEGVPPPSRSWSAVALSAILSNPCYTGTFTPEVRRNAQYSGRAGQAGASGEKRRAFDVPPLIGRAKWDRVQRRKEQNRDKVKNVRHGQEFFLRDVLRCGHCGGKVRFRLGAKRKSDGQRPGYYVCQRSKAPTALLHGKRQEKCRLRPCPSGILEEFVLRKILGPFGARSALNKDQILRELFPQGEAAKKSLRGLRAEETRLRGSIGELDARVSKLFVLYEQSGAKPREVRNRLARLRYEKQCVQARLEDVVQRIAQTEALTAQSDRVRTMKTVQWRLLLNVLHAIPGGSPELKKAFIESILNGPISVSEAHGNPNAHIQLKDRSFLVEFSVSGIADAVKCIIDAGSAGTDLGRVARHHNGVQSPPQGTVPPGSLDTS